MEAINHNKHNLKQGDMVILDKDFRNKSYVKILSFTPNQMYALVNGEFDLPEKGWQVMTARLSPLIK